jgi:hypothetical protein
MPFDCPDIADRLAALDADAGRMQRIARENVRQAALRHDWIHRLFTVYETLGLPPSEGMLARKERLRALAAQAAQGG